MSPVRSTAEESPNAASAAVAHAGPGPLRWQRSAAGMAQRSSSAGAGGSSRGSACDAGFTPAEIIIGVILVGILTTGVTVKAIQLMDRARDSAAQKTLRAAEVAAQAAFSVILPGGQSNFASMQVGASRTIDGKSASSNDYTNGANAAAIAALQAQEPGLQFTSYTTVGVNGLKDRIPDGTVWIEVNNKQIKNGSQVTLTGRNPNSHIPRTTKVPLSVSIRAGELIRLGVVAASGSTFCLITVADSSDGSLSGDGWQAVNERLTKAGQGADCGADLSTTVVNDNEFREMPGTSGTDPALSQPVSSLDSSNGKYYSTS